VGRAEQLGERLPVDVLEHEQQLAALLDDVEELHDVAVVDVRRDARLVAQHRHQLLVVPEAVVQALDRDRPPEARDALQTRDVDGRVTARRDFFVERVPPDASHA
jgi:hypothetical protein